MDRADFLLSFFYPDGAVEVAKFSAKHLFQDRSISDEAIASKVLQSFRPILSERKVFVKLPPYRDSPAFHLVAKMNQIVQMAQ